VPRIFAVILVVLGLFSQIGLDALSLCGPASRVEAFDDCCENGNETPTLRWADDSCRQDCTGCVCVKRVGRPAIYPRVDRGTEHSEAAAFSIAMFALPNISPIRETIAFNWVNESPPHIGLLRTVRLSI